MIELRKTPEFEKWFKELRDEEARVRIFSRFDRLTEGNPGDHKAVGDGIWELRIHVGPGYRLYYTKHKQKWILLLAGGDKGTQNKDIKLAKNLADRELGKAGQP